VTARHLGNRIHDLVDGRLSRADTYVAMAHLADCEECGTEWEQLRQERAALQTSGTGIDMSFARTLLGRDRIAEIAKAEPRRHEKVSKGRGTNFALVASVALIAGGLGLGGLYMLGAPSEARLDFDGASRVAGQSVQYMNAPSMRTGEQLNSWLHPEWRSSGLVPIEAMLLQAEDGSTVLVARILSGLETVTVTEQHGRLPRGMGETFGPGSTGDLESFVVREEPAQIVFEAGGTVVSLGCDCALEVLEGIAEEFPDGEDPSVIERIGDGFDSVTSAIVGD